MFKIDRKFNNCIYFIDYIHIKNVINNMLQLRLLL